MAVKLLPWDPADDLETEDDMKEYMEAALELDDAWGVAYVLSDISRAKRMERAIKSAWRNKKRIHKAERRGDVLDFRAIMQAANALGLRLCAGAESCEQNAVSNLNAALARCDAWGAALAMRDIAAAMGAESVVPHPKRGEAVDFAVVLDAARSLGLRFHAAAVAEWVGR